MRLKNSKQTKILAGFMLAWALVSYILGIVVFVQYGMSQPGTGIMYIITGAIWTFCGIIIMKNAKLQRIEEDSKKKINAFNYGKKKNLHKRVK